MTDHDTTQVPPHLAPVGRLLTAAEFHKLADALPGVEWFANLTNSRPVAPMKMRCAIVCGSLAAGGRRSFGPSPMRT